MCRSHRVGVGIICNVSEAILSQTNDNARMYTNNNITRYINARTENCIGMERKEFNAKTQIETVVSIRT